MCWKYEDEYNYCFDGLTLDIGGNETLIEWLDENYDVTVTAPEAFRDLLFDMLSVAHERGIIKPKE